MKSEAEIKEQLVTTYEHRLRLRVGRKTKRVCRNCIHGKSFNYNLGEFGEVTKYGCIEEHSFGPQCPFVCKYNLESIEDEMMNDIKCPSVCGAKEPKIAALLWVLHTGDTTNKLLETTDNIKKDETTEVIESQSFLERLLKRIF